MEQTRDMILANFQACTGVDDVGEAIYHLEETQWDLVAAVNRVMPPESQALPPVENMVESLENIPEDSLFPQDLRVPAPTANFNASPSSPSSAFSPPDAVQLPSPCFMSAIGASAPMDIEPSLPDHRPSTSHDSVDKNIPTIYFKIKYKDTIYDIAISSTKTVEELKTVIHQQTNVAPQCQILTGWVKCPSSDSDTLRSLGLPRNPVLLLTKLEQEASEPDRTSYTFNLNVAHGSKNYTLKFPGARTVLEVKTDVYTLTDIPVRHQVWTGWPASLKDDKTMLAYSGINYPVHELSVRRAALSEQPNSPAQHKRKVIVDPAESDASEEDFEDASESLTGDEDQELFMDDVPTTKLQALIPADTNDEMAGAIHFGEEFTNRYGVAHPEFYPGTLEDALKDSCLKPAKNRRLLAVYIHHDGSVLTNVFCTQLLGSESVLELLSTYFVCWGWDITYESNKLMLLSTVARNLGSMAAMTIRNMQIDRLPALLILTRTRSNTEIFTVVPGNVGASELLTSLLQAVDEFTQQQVSDLRDEEERAAREQIKTEQDKAYQASLAVDRAKEEAKKEQELLQEQERERQEKEREQEESRREAHRLEVERQLPAEPEEGSGDSVTKIRYRLPAGDYLERRFLSCTPLKALLDFLTVKGYPVENYKVIAGWPRRDLTSLDAQQSLAELKLCPQETVMIEER